MFLRFAVPLGLLAAVSVLSAAETSREVLDQFKLPGRGNMRRLGSKTRGWSYPFWFPSRPHSKHRNWQGISRRNEVRDPKTRKKAIVSVEVMDFGTVGRARDAMIFAAGHQGRAKSYRLSLSIKASAKLREAQTKSMSVHGVHNKPKVTPGPTMYQAAHYVHNVSPSTLEFQELDAGFKGQLINWAPRKVQTTQSVYVGYVSPRRTRYYQRIGAVPKEMSDSRMDPSEKYCYETRQRSYISGRVRKGIQETYIGRYKNHVIVVYFQKDGTPIRVNRPDALRKIDVKDADLSHPDGWGRVLATFFRLCGGKDQPFDSEREGVRLNLTCSADTYVPKKTDFVNVEFHPAVVEITGRVVDEKDGPIAGAVVSLDNPIAAVVTDETGKYRLRLRLEGTGVWKLQHNVKLVSNIKGLQCAVDYRAPLVANGRVQPINLKITADGKPLAGRDVRVDLPPEWTFNRCPVGYLKTSGKPWSTQLKTDDQGQIAVEAFPVPVTVATKLGRLREDEYKRYFPAIGQIIVKDIATEKECKATYLVNSPYPDIRKFRMIAVAAGQWQSKAGSELIIDDLDSGEFDVEMRLAGRVRIPPDKKDFVNKVYHHLQGKRLFFRYQAPNWGDDLNKQPGDLWQEFGMFNLQLGGKYLIDIGGSLMLKSVAVHKIPSGIAPNSEAYGKVLAFHAEQSGKVYDYAKGKWGLVELADKTDALKDDVTQISQQKTVSRKDVESKTIEATDIILGVVESAGVGDSVISKGGKAAKWLQKSQDLAVGVSKVNVPLEVLKVTYENAKFMHKLHQQFTAVANAQKGTELMPVWVTIKDPDGYEIIATRSVTIRTWEKEK